MTPNIARGKGQNNKYSEELEWVAHCLRLFFLRSFKGKRKN